VFLLLYHICNACNIQLFFNRRLNFVRRSQNETQEVKPLYYFLDNCDPLWIRVHKCLVYVRMGGYIESTVGAKACNIIKKTF